MFSRARHMNNMIVECWMYLPSSALGIITQVTAMRVSHNAIHLLQNDALMLIYIGLCVCA